MRYSLPPFVTAGVLALSLGACMASGQVHSSASISTPDLVYIGPSVQVIADYDEPIFYTSNYYWRTDGAVWYRSSNYSSGWVRIETAPAVLRQIERPSAYVHYHARATVNAQPATSRDQREEAQDRRDERHDEKAQQKEERKEEREDRKEDRKDRKDKSKGR